MFRIALVFVVLAMTPWASFASNHTLRVFTWEEYFDPDLITQFETEFDATVEFVYYESDEIRDQVMAETLGFGVDVILVDEAELSAYITQGWLKPIQTAKLENLENHGTNWLKTIPEADGYAIPYGWGTYGITYRTDLVQQPITHWADLFDPEHDIAGSIQMSSQAAELLAIALMANGYSPFTTDSVAIKKAETSLIEQKESVFAYKIPDLESDDNLLITGQVKAAMTYSSDALFLQDEDENLAYVSPDGGNIYWIDLWTISARSQQTQLAHDFLDFVLRPDVVATNVEYHYTATFSETAKALLPDYLRNNETLYPANIEGIDSFPPPSRTTVRALMRVINTLNIE